jgi:two-component system, sensor histidine kinase
VTAADAASPQPHDEGLDRARLSVVSAQASSLRWQIIATAVVVCALVWRFVPTAVVVTWLALVVGVREVRAWQLRAMVDNVSLAIDRKLPRVVAWNLVLGATNGAAAFFMAWLDPTYDALLTMILVSWAAGAVSTSAPLLRAYVVYSACIFVPAALMWIIGWTPLGLGVAALILMFAGVQFRFAKQNANTFEESYRIRLENENLARQLAVARDVAEAANRAKSRFLAAASHDLRQPLHALTLHSGLLAQDPLSPDAPAIANEISLSIDSLAKLLDSLLDISKLDAGVVVVERRPIKLHRLIAHLVRTHEPQAAEKGIALRFECPLEAVVHTDPLLLERLLRNLLDNALKYTDRGEVCILATGDEQTLQVSVRDSGRGIPEPAQAKVFEEFYQVESEGHDRAQGLGLGLAIVARLAVLLELPISMVSQPGQGTTIGFSIPRVPGFADDRPADTAQSIALQGLKVLFIDDEESVRRAMRNVLKRFGCESAEASGSEEALECARSFAVELVLADCRLRDGDSGIEAVRRLREQRPGLPALLISGDTDAERLREAEQSGLQLLHKPVTLQRLQEAMTAVLQAGAGNVAAGESA